MPDEYRTNLLRAVVGFELPIARLEGKFKLGQNRPDPDRGSTLTQLREGNTDATELAAFIDQRMPQAFTSGDRTR